MTKLTANELKIQKLESELKQMRKESKQPSLKGKRRDAPYTIIFKSGRYKKYSMKMRNKNEAMQVAKKYRKDYGFGAKVVTVYNRKGTDSHYPNYYVYIQN